MTLCLIGSVPVDGRETVGNSRWKGVEGSLERRDGLGEFDVAWIPCTIRLVTESMRRRLLMSTIKLKCCKKSAPMIALAMSATTKIQRKVRRRLRFRVRDRVPYGWWYH